jgi:hypothetical protein
MISVIKQSTLIMVVPDSPEIAERGATWLVVGAVRIKKVGRPNHL